MTRDDIYNGYSQKSNTKGKSRRAETSNGDNLIKKFNQSTTPKQQFNLSTSDQSSASPKKRLIHQRYPAVFDEVEGAKNKKISKHRDKNRHTRETWDEIDFSSSSEMKRNLSLSSDLSLDRNGKSEYFNDEIGSFTERDLSPEENYGYVSHLKKELSKHSRMMNPYGAYSDLRMSNLEPALHVRRDSDVAADGSPSAQQHPDAHQHLASNIFADFPVYKADMNDTVPKSSSLPAVHDLVGNCDEKKDGSKFMRDLPERISASAPSIPDANYSPDEKSKSQQRAIYR